MGVNVNVPQKRQRISGGDSGGSNIFGLAGAIAGGLAGGGPAGAMAGMQAGQAIGGMVAPGSPGRVIEEQQGRAVETGPSDALSRRMKSIDESNLNQIQQSIDSLKYVDDEATRAALAKPLLKAEYLASRGK
jgi:hypothetical protein